MNTEPELLNERLERLAMVLDEIMPSCALLVRDAIELMKEQEDLGTELTNAVELIHKKNERIEKLLKEREAVEPMLEQDSMVCGVCGHEVIWQKMIGDGIWADEQLDYCPHCGQAVKWE